MSYSIILKYMKKLNQCHICKQENAGKKILQLNYFNSVKYIFL